MRVYNFIRNVLADDPIEKDIAGNKEQDCTKIGHNFSYHFQNYRRMYTPQALGLAVCLSITKMQHARDEGRPPAALHNNFNPSREPNSTKPSTGAAKSSIPVQRAVAAAPIAVSKADTALAVTCNATTPWVRARGTTSGQLFWRTAYITLTFIALPNCSHAHLSPGATLTTPTPPHSIALSLPAPSSALQQSIMSFSTLDTGPLGNAFFRTLNNWDDRLFDQLAPVDGCGPQGLVSLSDLEIVQADSRRSEDPIGNYAANVDPAGHDENTGAVTYNNVPGSGASADVNGDLLAPELNSAEGAAIPPAPEHHTAESTTSHSALENSTIEVAVDHSTPENNTVVQAVNCLTRDGNVQAAANFDDASSIGSSGGVNTPESPNDVSTSSGMDDKDRVIADLLKRVRDLEESQGKTKDSSTVSTSHFTGIDGVPHHDFSPQLQNDFSPPIQYDFSQQLPYDFGFGTEFNGTEWDIFSGSDLSLSPPGIFSPQNISPQNGYEQSPGVPSTNAVMARTSTAQNVSGLACNNVQNNLPSPPVNDLTDISMAAFQANLMNSALANSNMSAGGNQFSIGNTPDPFGFEPSQPPVPSELPQVPFTDLTPPAFNNEIDLVENLYPTQPETQSTQDPATLTPTKKGKGKAGTRSTSTPRKPRARKASPKSGRGSVNTPPNAETSPSDDGDESTPTPGSSSSSPGQETTGTPTKKRGRKSATDKNTSPTKRARKTTKSTKTPAVPSPEVEHLLPKRPLPHSSQMWDKKRVEEEQRIFNQAAYVAADPATRGRPLAQLMNTAFENLSQGEKARLLLPILNGMDPFEVDETDEAIRKLSKDLGIGYGAARERIACMKAQRKNMDEEAAGWEKVTQLV
ncbi:hypothetical protein DM02DRAFT_622075 [Periconia macrospinosa]|uniref:Uncharacterized protein n=1 Tax=Periconia macrospinosa TaxID=97972 RepID=A0A2V1EAA9_9PLEO|nr:hypothetical protein DM02DRAFT_622075 [Periconia macrospinosa]